MIRNCIPNARVIRVTVAVDEGAGPVGVVDVPGTLADVADLAGPGDGAG